MKIESEATLTVGQLKALLAGLPEDAFVGTSCCQGSMVHPVLTQHTVSSTRQPGERGYYEPFAYGAPHMETTENNEVVYVLEAQDDYVRIEHAE